MNDDSMYSRLAQNTTTSIAKYDVVEIVDKRIDLLSNIDEY